MSCAVTAKSKCLNYHLYNVNLREGRGEMKLKSVSTVGGEWGGLVSGSYLFIRGKPAGQFCRLLSLLIFWTENLAFIMVLICFKSTETAAVILRSSHRHFGLWCFVQLIVWDVFDVFFKAWVNAFLPPSSGKSLQPFKWWTSDQFSSLLNVFPLNFSGFSHWKLLEFVW